MLLSRRLFRIAIAQEMHVSVEMGQLETIYGREGMKGRVPRIRIGEEEELPIFKHILHNIIQANVIIWSFANEQHRRSYRQIYDNK